MGYRTFLTEGDVFLNIKCEKCVSVLMAMTSTFSLRSLLYLSATADSSVGQTKVKSAG